MISYYWVRFVGTTATVGLALAGVLSTAFDKLE